MKSRYLLFAILLILVGCGKKLGPTSPDIWPPFVVETKIYADHVDFRFNEPIVTTQESVTLLNEKGDTIPVMDTVSMLQSYSVSVFPDTQYLRDTLYVILKGITDSSMNRMRSYEKLFVFSNVTSSGSLYVNKIILKRIRREGLYLDLSFNMPVMKNGMNIFVSHKLYTDSNLHFLNPHEISIAVSDTPDFILVPDDIRSFSGKQLEYPYLKRYANISFVKKVFKINIPTSKDSAANYAIFVVKKTIDIVPVGRSTVIDSILSDTCDIYIVSKDRASFLWEKREIRGDSAIIISNFKNKGIKSFWHDIIDKFSK